MMGISISPPRSYTLSDIADFPWRIKQVRMHFANEASRVNGLFHKVQVTPEPQNSLSRPLSMARALCHKRPCSPRSKQEEPRMKKLILSALIIVASSAVALAQ